MLGAIALKDRSEDIALLFHKNLVHTKPVFLTGLKR